MTDTESSSPLTLDPDLQARLTVLAARAGVSVHALADSVLRAHADEQEQLVDELAEDEERWQRYLAGGQSIAFESVRRRVRELAGEAARKAEPR